MSNFGKLPVEIANGATPSGSSTSTVFYSDSNGVPAVLIGGDSSLNIPITFIRQVDVSNTSAQVIYTVPSGLCLIISSMYWQSRVPSATAFSAKIGIAPLSLISPVTNYSDLGIANECQAIPITTDVISMPYGSNSLKVYITTPGTGDVNLIVMGSLVPSTAA
jgi:hypothetical protein